MLRRLRVMDRILHPDISQETIEEVLASPDVCRSIAAVFRDESYRQLASGKPVARGHHSLH